MEFDVTYLTRVLGIVVVDLVLSGDNAVVIGLAARHLPPRRRRQAILLGGVAAVGLRVLLTAVAAVLLDVPLLQFVGGALLLWIAYRLLRAEEEPGEHGDEGGAATAAGTRGLAAAVRTIVIADVVMSLDNILAVGGVAHGNLELLLFGLGLSIPLIFFGSNLVAILSGRFPWLVYVGSAVLGWAAAGMMLEDGVVGPWLPRLHTPVEPFTLVVTALLLLAAYLMNRRVAARPAATAREH